MDSRFSKELQVTPIPRATSTAVKRTPKRQVINKEGLSNKTKFLPSQYLNKNFATPSITTGIASESTVNESDLLKQFEPTQISTPRPSFAVDTRNSLLRFKHQLEHSDISLSKLCGEFSKVIADIDIDDESFVTGDLAAVKIAQEEQSWLKKRGEMGCASIRPDSLFTQLEDRDMTDFFRKKSEMSSVFLQDSPEKDNNPEPLIDASNITESVIDFAAFDNADTTSKVFDLLRNGAGKENKPVENNLRSMNVSRQSHNLCDQSVSSVRTVSSLSNLIGGKLPLETNRVQLVWGCIPVGKKVSQTFVVRNRSSNKLHFEIASSNINFRVFIAEGDSETVSTLKIMLYPSETRCIKAAFIPTTIGASIGVLTFTPISPELKIQQTKRQNITLFGYGGHAHVDISEVAKDSNMKMWLSLGKFNNQSDVTTQFTIRNIGTLSAFACFSFTSKALFGVSNIHIEPSHLVIMPRSQETVKISFVPTKNDIRDMFVTTDQVVEIGVVQILSGAEPLRGRIRNISTKLEKAASEIPNPIITKLSRKFPNEKMPMDIYSFNETANSIKELLQNLDRKEIVLTMESNVDILMGQVPGIDDTLFQSIAEKTITVGSYKTNTPYMCSVEPQNIILTPPIKSSNYLLLMSNHSGPLRFQITAPKENVLIINPLRGIISPNDTVIVNVDCKTKILNAAQTNQSLQVVVNIEDEVFEVNVKVIVLKPTKM